MQAKSRKQLAVQLSEIVNSVIPKWETFYQRRLDKANEYSKLVLETVNSSLALVPMAKKMYTAAGEAYRIAKVALQESTMSNGEGTRRHETVLPPLILVVQPSGNRAY